MEHRNGSRSSICLNVNLCQGSRDMGWHKVKNLGVGGLCLTGRVDDLANNSMVDVLIEQLQGSELKQFSLKALVVHQAENSMGLMWAGYAPGYIGIVPELMAAAA